jgi:hypothetical protein
VPVGVAVLPAFGVTVAVKLMLPPVVIEVDDAVSAVVVAAWTAGAEP